MKRFAIIMASDEYAERAYPPTPHCHDDARLLRSTLIECCDYAEQDILFELLDPQSPITPTDLIARITTVGARSAPGDTILFFYAGHGGLFSGDTYLILPTTVASNKSQTAVPFRDISNALRLPDRLNVRVFDTCHSGQDVRAASEGDGVERGDPDLDTTGLARAVATVTEQGWITFAACKADEYSHPDFTLKQGIFTWAFCESLKEHPADTDVYPEHIKIALCKKVKDWCSTNRRTQTPVFNSALSGNVAFARRKLPVPPGKDSNPAPQQEPLGEIEARLAALRKHPSPGSKAHNEALVRLLETAKASLEAAKETFVSFGCAIEIKGPVKIDYSPKELHRGVVNYVRASGFRPLHEVDAREIKDERPTTLYEQIAGIRGPVVTKRTEHVLSQSYEVPDSYVEFIVHSDGCVPGALLFFYLLPLQLRAALVAGVALSRETSFADKDWSLKHIDCTLLNLDHDETPNVHALVRSKLVALESKLRASVVARLRILEEEAGMKPQTPG